MAAVQMNTSNATVYASQPNGAGPLRPTQTTNPFQIAIAYRSGLSDSAKLLGFSPGVVCNPMLIAGTCTCTAACDFCCWDKKLKSRAYVMVQENRLETNYPHTECCGLAVADYVTVRYLDTFDSQTRATCCTPYHFCFCVELCGGVVATAPCDACNTCMFPCFRTYYPGIADPNAFTSALIAVQASFKNSAGPRATPGSAMPGPNAQNMG